MALRRPQDAFVGDPARGVPDLSTLDGTVLHYAARHAKAVADRDLQARAEACRGLVARGAESHAWCLDALGRGGEAGEDAVGVLAWTRIPALLAKQLRARMKTLPNDVARDLRALMMVHRATKDVDWTGVPLAGEGEPFTHILRFIEAPFARFVEEHAAWRERLGARGVDSAHAGDLRALLPLLEPATMNGTKVLIVETRPPSPWTAVLAQGSDLGWVDHFADLLQTRSVKTSYAPHVVRDGLVRRYGAVSLSICDGRHGDLAPLHTVRVIMASHQDSGWDWQLGGEPQPFEELDAYAARTIRARFDLPRLNRYCHALGIRRDEEDFYGPPRSCTRSTRRSGRAHRRPGSRARSGGERTGTVAEQWPVLGIDAAWTTTQPTGVALLSNASGAWRCLGLASSYASFIALAAGAMRRRMTDAFARQR